MDAEELRALALALPEAEERETWGHPTFRVRDKMFLTLAADGAAGTVKATLEDQSELVARTPRRGRCPPTWDATAGWAS